MGLDALGMVLLLLLLPPEEPKATGDAACDQQGRQLRYEDFIGALSLTLYGVGEEGLPEQLRARVRGFHQLLCGAATGADCALWAGGM